MTCDMLCQGQSNLVANWFSGHSLTVSRVVSSANSYYGDEIEEDERVEGVWRPALWLELEARDVVDSLSRDRFTFNWW